MDVKEFVEWFMNSAYWHYSFPRDHRREGDSGLLDSG